MPPAIRSEPTAAGSGSPEFGTRLEQAAEMLETCAGCGICQDKCPAFSDLFGYLDQRDVFRDGTLSDARRDRFLDLCYYCGQCSAICPLGFRLDQIAWERRTEAVRSRPELMPSYWLTRPLRMLRLRKLLAPVLNRLKRIAFVRRLFQRISGISERAFLPEISAENLGSWQDRRLKGNPVPESRTEIVFFASCDAHLSDFSGARAAVQLLERSGARVTVAAPQCCGGKAFAAGDAAEAVQQRKALLEALKVHLAAGKTVVIESALCHEVLSGRHGLLGKEKEEAPVRELASMLWELQRQGHIQFVQRADDRIAFVPGPFGITSGTDQAYLNLLRLVPGLEVNRVKESGGSSAGAWSVREQEQDTVDKADQRLLESVRRTQATTVVSDCASCRAHLHRAGPELKVVDPLEILLRSTGK